MGASDCFMLLQEAGEELPVSLFISKLFELYQQHAISIKQWHA